MKISLGYFCHQMFLAAIVLMAAGVAWSQEELPGNVFHQYNIPQTPNATGIAINNPQNMGGGNWVGGSNSPYPVYGPSPVLDGVGTSGNVWVAGTFGGGGMCNVGITSGVYGTDPNDFTNVPFGAIDTVRIWAQNWQNSDLSWWAYYPQQVEIGYTTAGFNPGNGYSYNTDNGGVLDGVLPGTYPNVATITAVNGAPVLSATSNNPAYGTGWANLNGQFTRGVTVVNPGHDTAAYVDLTVAIPAGATSICVSFGQDNGSTNNPGGLYIADIQATLHPTWTNATASGIWDSSTINWVSAASQPVTYSDGLPVTFDDTGSGGTVTIQGTGSPSQVRPYSVTFASNTASYTLTGDPIGGAATMSLTGTGTVTLASANTFTGNTTVAAGTLVLAHSAALQNSTLAPSGGSVVFDQSVSGHAFSVGGLSGSGSFALQDNAGPPNPVALTVGGNNASTNYSGVLSGPGGLTKIGTGTLTLSNSNSYSGQTVINQGTLQVGSPGYRYYKFTVTANTGNDGYNQVSELHFYTNGAWVPAGSGSPANGGENQWSNANDNDAGTKFGQAGVPYSIMYDFGAPRAFTGYNWATANDSTPNRNPNEWEVQGSNNGTTWTTVDDRTGASQGTGPNNTFTWAGVNPSNYAAFDGSLNGGAANAYPLLNPTGYLPSNSSLVIAAQGTFDIGGARQTIASLSDGIGGGGTVTNSSGAPATLTVAPTDGGTTTFSGSIQDGAGGVSLVLAGSGTLVLSGTNSYSGGTFVENGTLVLANPAALRDGSSLTVGDPSLFAAPVVPSSTVAGSAITPVPEPGTLVLFLAGGAAALLAGRRRRNSRRA